MGPEAEPSAEVDAVEDNPTEQSPLRNYHRGGPEWYLRRTERSAVRSPLKHELTRLVRRFGEVQAECLGLTPHRGETCAPAQAMQPHSSVYLMGTYNIKNTRHGKRPMITSGGGGGRKHLKKSNTNNGLFEGIHSGLTRPKLDGFVSNATDDCLHNVHILFASNDNH